MQKSSLKLYLATFIFTLTLVSLTFAGEGHCPIAPPPPDEDGFNSVPAVVNTNPSEGSNYQLIKGFWELLSQSTDLF